MNKKTPILITGGCGFVGRRLVKKFNAGQEIWIIDDLSIGRHPDVWLGETYTVRSKRNNYIHYVSPESQIHFIKADVIDLFSEEMRKKGDLPVFGTVFHLASIIGGRMTIDGDPIHVSRDLAIDSVFFQWLTKNNAGAKNVLYASSSAAYPTVLQKSSGYKKLRENEIQFNGYVGMPDMTYGWSKLSGEYLARLTAERYGIPVACVRPFSGYGEDQDFSYPIPAIAARVARREDPLSVWGTGKQGRDFVHIDDCVDAMFVIMKHIKDGSACNIGSGKLTSFLQVLRIFTRLEGYDPEIKTLPDKPVGVSSRYADTTRLASMGWRPSITKETGFGRVLAFIKSRRKTEYENTIRS